MWPRKKARGAEILRVGRLAIERWASDAGGLILAAREVLPPTALGTLSQLASSIAAVYSEPPVAPVTIIVESAWLPIVLADTGGQLLSQRQARELVRHRLGVLQSSSSQAASGWDVRTDFKLGERFVLGFGGAPDLVDILRSSVEDLGGTAGGIQPAFSWGWQRRRICDGWWLWQEQDRWLAARLLNGRVVGLNAALPPVDNEESLERLVAIEASRLGMIGTEPQAEATAWREAASRNGRPSKVIWRSIGSTPSAQATAETRTFVPAESTP